MTYRMNEESTLWPCNSTVRMSLTLDSGKKIALFPIIDVSASGNIVVHRHMRSDSPFKIVIYHRE